MCNVILLFVVYFPDTGSHYSIIYAIDQKLPVFKNEGETFLPLEISTSLKFLLPNGVEGILLNDRLTRNTDHKLVSFVFSNVVYTMILHVRLSLRSFCSCTVRSATTTTPSGPSPDPTDSTRLSLSSSASYFLLLHLIYQSLS